MVSINQFRGDTKAINDGDWVRVDEARFGDLEIRTRGYTDEFIDAQNRELARAAEEFNGDRDRIPNSDRRRINARLLEDFLVLDVRNLTDDGGLPISVATFHSMLYQQEYSRLAAASWQAAQRVSTRSRAQTERALGNSQPPSAPTSNGATSAPN